MLEKKNSFDKESDETLMLSFQGGSESAFEDLVGRYKIQLHSYIYRLLGERERSEEISQEVFIRLYRCRKTYRTKAKFSTFIYRIAHNLAFNEIRNRIRRKTQAQDELEELIIDETSDYIDPEALYEKKELEEILAKELEALRPEKYREVILLCDVQGLPYKEVGKILEVSLGTVQSRLSRGRLKLKQRMEDALK